MTTKPGLLAASRVASAIVVSCLACGASAQTYPDKPVRVIVPAPAGGALDIVARHVNQKLSEAFGTQFMIDNRGGASGAIGAEAVARAPADGYTLLFTSATAVCIDPYFAAKSVDPLRTYTPVVLIGFSPMVLVVHPSVPAHSVKELVALAKARPDAFGYASNGTGSLSHVTAALFMQLAGVRMIHVPYRGAAPAVIDTVAGHVSVLFAGYPSVSAQQRAGKLRALAVTTLQRAAIAPELPTVAESGFPGFESTQWWGLYGPAGLPTEIVDRLNASTNKVLRMAEIKKALAQDGAEPAGGTPAELAAHHKTDYEKWGKVIHTAGIENE
jgi:tripartite-type tricarboxylate transporter receptor subunit TctC